MPQKLLFVCSKNKWRSRTAETIYRNSPHYHVRSAGTGKTAQIRLNQSILDWADIVFVMEPRHRELLRRRFQLPSHTPLHVLHIEDIYPYLNEELIELLHNGVEQYCSR